MPNPNATEQILNPPKAEVRSCPCNSHEVVCLQIDSFQYAVCQILSAISVLCGDGSCCQRSASSLLLILLGFLVALVLSTLGPFAPLLLRLLGLLGGTAHIGAFRIGILSQGDTASLLSGALFALIAFGGLDSGLCAFLGKLLLQLGIDILIVGLKQIVSMDVVGEKGQSAMSPPNQP